MSDFGNKWTKRAVRLDAYDIGTIATASHGHLSTVGVLTSVTFGDGWVTLGFHGREQAVPNDARVEIFKPGAP